MNMWFVAKTVVSSMIIAYASWLSGKKPFLAGFLIAMPLMSALAILFSYFEYRDMNKVNDFAVSILIAVPLSLSFFIPFLLNRWLKFGFWPTYLLAIGFVVIAYLFHRIILQSN